MSLRKVIARPWLVVLSGVFTVFFMIILYSSMGRALGPGIPGVFSMQTAFSRDRLFYILSCWGPALETYLRLTWLDFLYALSYGVFLSGLLGILLRGTSGGLSCILYIPLIAAGLDWAENFLHLYLLPHYRNLSQEWIFIVSLLSSLKWFLAFLSLLFLVILGIKKFVDLKQSCG